MSLARRGPGAPRATLLVTLLLATPASARAAMIASGPALTATALREELRAASQRRQEELAALARQRAELEKAAVDLAAARSAFDAEKAEREKTGREKAERETASQEKRVVPAARAVPPETPPASPEALARTVKGMKTEQAAALVTRLERPLAVEVLRRMKPADAGAVLEKLDTALATQLVEGLASPQKEGRQ